MNRLFLRQSNTLRSIGKRRTFYSEIKNVVSNAIVDLRGSLIETLGKRISKTDAAILNKYILQITNINPAEEKSNNNNNNKIENSPSPSSSHQEPFPRKRDIIVVPENQINNNTSAAEVYSKDIGLLHPVFGQMVCDLGYKMVYSTNIRRLALSPVWEKQRILRPERAARIANAMKGGKEAVSLDGFSTNKAPIRLPGVITMYHDKITGKIGIVDGQHRVGALVMLAQQGLWNDFQRNILVDVFPTQNEEEVVRLFKEINSGEPVRLIDMEFPPSPSVPSATPSSAPVVSAQLETSSTVVESSTVANSKVAVATEASTSTPTPPTTVVALPLDVRSIITDAVDELAAKYDSMFKPTSRCRSPHLNPDVLRDDLYQAEFIVMHRITSAKQLVEKLEEINVVIGQQYNKAVATATTNNSTASTKSKSEESAITKAIANNFYLGLGDKSWIHNGTN